MFRTISIPLVAAAIALLPTTTFADVPLSQAIEIAIQGRFADEKKESVTLNKHSFYIRPMTMTKEKDSLTAEGHFRHRHVGKDDRIHFRIVVRRGQPPEATITKIEYRGVLGSSTAKINVPVTGVGVVDTPIQIGARIVEALKKLKLQRFIDGKWEPEAGKIVAAIGARLAREGK